MLCVPYKTTSNKKLKIGYSYLLFMPQLAYIFFCPPFVSGTGSKHLCNVVPCLSKQRVIWFSDIHPTKRGLNTCILCSVSYITKCAPYIYAVIILNLNEPMRHLMLCYLLLLHQLLRWYRLCLCLQVKIETMDLACMFVHVNKTTMPVEHTISARVINNATIIIPWTYFASGGVG